MPPGNPLENIAGAIEMGDGARLFESVGQAMINDVRSGVGDNAFNDAWKAMTVPGPVTNFLHDVIIGKKR